MENVPQGNLYAEKELSPQTLYSDSTVEYTLPDYLPEMRRVLSVRTRVVPSGQYIGQSRAEFAGTCMHHVLYCGADGQVWGVSLSSDFELTTPLSGADPTTVKCHAYHTAESVTCRLSGPRRVSVRAVVASRVRLWTPCADMPQTDFAGEGCQRLQRRCTARRVHLFSSERIHYSETVKAEAAGELRVLCTDGAVLVRGVHGEGGGAVCSGEVYLKALCAGQDGAPFAVCAKIPFEETVQDIPQGEGMTMTACGYVTDLEAAVGTDGDGNALVTFDASVVLDGLAEVNEVFSAVVDLFSESLPVETSYIELPLQKSMGAAIGAFTLDGTATCEECDCKGAFSVADTAVSARLLSLSANGSAVVAEGEAQVSMLLSVPAEQGEGATAWQAASFKSPVKMEILLQNPLPQGAEIEGELSIVFAKGRVDRDRLCFDCEANLCVRAVTQAPVRMVAAYTADATRPFAVENAEIISAYLKEGDTLWDIAKRYHTSPENIAKTNDLPPQVLEEADASYALDGYMRLLIEK